MVSIILAASTVLIKTEGCIVLTSLIMRVHLLLLFLTGLSLTVLRLSLVDLCLCIRILFSSLPAIQTDGDLRSLIQSEKRSVKQQWTELGTSIGHMMKP